MSFLGRALRWPSWLIEAAPFFLMMGLFRVIGVDAASAAGGWLARTLGPLTGPHRTARRNLARALPDMPEGDAQAILRGMWDNLGRVFGEYPHFRRFVAFPNPRIETTGAGHVQAALARGKGAILVSGHFANWELMALNAYRAGFDGAEVYRPINNPLVNAWIVRQRRRFAYPLQVSKTGDGARTLLKALKAGKSLAMLADQKHREGMAVPFFGRDAMTVPGPAVLAMRTGAALVPVTMVRTGGARFRMTFWPEMTVARTGDTAADVKAGLLTINTWLEDAVRANPAMWLWAHDRWDDRPRKNRKPVRSASAAPPAADPGAPGTS